MRIVLACLALGVAAIAAVGTLRAGLEAGLQADGARILGGDVELRSGNRPATPEALAWIAARGGQTSAVVTLRSMLVAPSGERMLVEMKAVDKAYPLFGALELDPPVPLATRQELNAVPILQHPRPRRRRRTCRASLSTRWWRSGWGSRSATRCGSARRPSASRPWCGRSPTRPPPRHCSAHAP
ncbi:hypothetical protein [Dankookia sp. P2]|uniref:hypothetical protein n=1 Tax=Dankookia sp. P2 TaxID=3423955 RepID=UPI003D67F2F2